MCGIAGIFGEANEGLAREFCRILEHRGPDDQGFYVTRQGPVTLANRRLAILDLSLAGHQPMATDDSRHVLVYNGELYNFAELKAEMESQGHRFRSRCDTEVLLEILARDGAGALRKLNGMFAFALWESRERTGILARDAFGIKPLYYAPLPGGRLIFGSEIKALLLHPEVPTALDPAGLQDYLAFLWTPDPRTLWQGIYKLPPGHFLEWREGNFSVHQYYELPKVEPGAAMDDHEAAGRLREHLGRAVRRQLVSDVPVGLFLSGGLDSSALLAQTPDAHQVRCYTAAFPKEDNAFDQFNDDLPYARAVAARFGIPLTEFEIRAEVTTLLPKLLYFLDEPLADPAIINTYLICRQARQDGTIVLLSGQGADELLGGYRRHQGALLSARLAGIPRPLRRAVASLAARLPAAMPGRVGGTFRRIRKLLSSLEKPPLEQFAAYCQWLTDAETNSLLHPDLEAALRGRNPSDGTFRLMEQSPSPDLLDRMLYRDLKTFLPALNLTYTDKMGMAASVEARVPYLDLELAEFAWRLPARQKVRGRRGKWLLREAMRGVLPGSILNRPKTGFGAPVRQWMRRELREMTGDLLSPSALRAAGCFSVEGVGALRDRFDAGQGDHGYSLWALLIFQLWREVYLRNPSREISNRPLRLQSQTQLTVAARDSAVTEPRASASGFHNAPHEPSGFHST